VAKNLKSFSDIPGPKGLPVIGTLWDYMKKDGLKFNKLFEVCRPIGLMNKNMFSANEPFLTINYRYGFTEINQYNADK